VTSADSHWEVARACLAAGRHCFVEKPLARTLAEGRLLEAVARPAAAWWAGRSRLSLPPGDGDVARGPRRRAYRRSALRDRPLLGVQAAPDGRGHHADRRDPLLSISSRISSVARRPGLARCSAISWAAGLDDLSVTIVHYGEVPAIVEASYFTPGTWRECVIVASAARSWPTTGPRPSRSTSRAPKARRCVGGRETGKEELPTRREEPSAARARRPSSTRAPAARPIRFRSRPVCAPSKCRSGRTGGSARLRRSRFRSRLDSCPGQPAQSPGRNPGAAGDGERSAAPRRRRNGHPTRRDDQRRAGQRSSAREAYKGRCA